MAGDRYTRREKRIRGARQLLAEELRSSTAIKGLLSAAVAEFFGMACFLLLATGTVASGCHTPDTARNSGATNSTLQGVEPGACFIGTTNVLNIALAFGLSIFILVYALASFSGGHLNPAVTTAMLCARRISLLRWIVYIIAQVAGAILGSALVLATDWFGFRAALGTTNRLSDWATVGSALGVEILLTAIFVFIVMAATDQTRGASTPHLPALAPLAIGVAVFLAHIIAVPIDGTSINPARSFGPAVVAGHWHQQWIFWVGPLLGGAVVGLLYEHLAYRALAYVGPAEEPERRKPGAGPDGPQEFAV